MSVSRGNQEAVRLVKFVSVAPIVCAMTERRRRWRTTHLVAIVLIAAVSMVALAVGVGRSSESSLQSSVDTNSEISSLGRQADRLDDLVAQLVLNARRPVSPINTPELVERRLTVILAEVDAIALSVSDADHLPESLTDDASLRRRLTTITESIGDHAAGALDAAMGPLDRVEELALLDASYRLFRDDLRFFEDELARYEAAQLEAQAESSRSVSTWVLAAAGLGFAVIGGAAIVGIQVARRERELTALLQRQVAEDALTGLANRRGLLDALESQSQSARPQALCFLDLDQFKRINDSLGHAAGDQVLCEVANRLKHTFGFPNTVARLGGDEFAIVLADGRDPFDAAELAVQLVASPIHVSGHRLELTASLGVRILSGGIDPVDALREADMAMYEAKADASLSVAQFEPSLKESAEELMVTESRLRQALREQSLEVHYQPLVDGDGALVGAEALVRWRFEGQLVPPGAFLPLATRLGMMGEIDEWVMHQAARDIVALNRLLGSSLWVSVNVDAATLNGERLIDQVAHVLDTDGMAPEWLVVEVTEQAAIDHVEVATRVLRQLQQLGVRAAIDDFGSGHSSLTRLDRLPIDIVKIDRALLPPSPEDERRSDLFRGIVEMVRHLGLDVVAEGIETADQARLAADSGCAVLQGYHIARPAPFVELRTLAARSLRLSDVDARMDSQHVVDTAHCADGVDRPVRL